MNAMRNDLPWDGVYEMPCDPQHLNLLAVNKQGRQLD